MNPVEWLESKGWNNTNKHITCKKVGNVWKLTYIDNGPIGQYTVNHLTQHLQSRHKFTVTKYTIKNAKRPTIIYSDMPKRSHYLTMWVEEKPYNKTDWKIKEVKINKGTVLNVVFVRDFGRTYYPTTASLNRLENLLKDVQCYHPGTNERLAKQYNVYKI